MIIAMGPFIKYVTLKSTFFDPPIVTLCQTFCDPPIKISPQKLRPPPEYDKFQLIIHKF